MSTPVVVAASHHGMVSPGAVTWHSHYVLSAPVDEGTIVFARPLPADTRVLRPSDALVPTTNERGELVSLTLLQGGRDLVLETVEHGQPGAIAPPLAVGAAPQRVSLEGTGEPLFAADPAVGVVRHVGWAAAGDLDHAERSRCDATLARFGEPDRADPTYVRATPEIATHGLVGHVTTREERGRPAVIGTMVAFAVVVAALVVLVRRLGHDARAERAESEIEDAFRKMGADG
jgi:hypothetical protein